MSERRDDYALVAPFYEWIGGIVSRRQILRSKTFQLSFIKPGQKVLYAGGGAAEDAILCASLGAKVTIVDKSDAMLRLARKKIESQHPIETIHNDIFMHDRIDFYDVVICNYFLNVFAEDKMWKVFSHLRYLCKADGLIMIADFSPPEGSFLSRLVQRIYYYSALLVFRLLTRNAWHRIYDYRPLYEASGFKIEIMKDFLVTPIGPSFSTYIGRKIKMF